MRSLRGSYLVDRWLLGHSLGALCWRAATKRSGRGLKKGFLRAVLVHQRHSFVLLARALGIEALARDA